MDVCEWTQKGEHPLVVNLLPLEKRINGGRQSGGVRKGLKNKALTPKPTCKMATDSWVAVGGDVTPYVRDDAPVAKESEAGAGSGTEEIPKAVES